MLRNGHEVCFKQHQKHAVLELSSRCIQAALASIPAIQQDPIDAIVLVVVTVSNTGAEKRMTDWAPVTYHQHHAIVSVFAVAFMFIAGATDTNLNWVPVIETLFAMPVQCLWHSTSKNKITGAISSVGLHLIATPRLRIQKLVPCLGHIIKELTAAPNHSLSGVVSILTETTCFCQFR